MKAGAAPRRRPHRLRAQSLVNSFEGGDQWLASGMESGVEDGHIKLDALVAQPCLKDHRDEYRRSAGELTATVEAPLRHHGTTSQVLQRSAGPRPAQP
ncbi:MAG TPA: hypothetical protein VM287_14405 [Egibacteraceae bacterium]|jgi:hypothetical protein|nr:hypothetical protein [Egibacteraceae bacterium]